jgi:lysophospholipase L1-like esterase
MDDVNRREFLLASAMFTASACSSHEHASSNTITTPGTPSSPYTLPNGARVLFQGDSITDSDRSAATTDPNNADAMGTGYALFVAQYLLLKYPPKQLLFYNRSNGGDTVPLLQARWQTDTIDLQPDFLNIMIGINDFAEDSTDPNVATTYEQNYTALINSTLQALPNVKLVILEPYADTSSGTPSSVAAFAAVRAAAAQVAQQANAIFVPLQDMFTQYISAQPSSHYWLIDNTHPTIAGSAAIANQWIQTVGL